MTGFLFCCPTEHKCLVKPVGIFEELKVHYLGSNLSRSSKAKGNGCKKVPSIFSHSSCTVTKHLSRTIKAFLTHLYLHDLEFTFQGHQR